VLGAQVTVVGENNGENVPPIKIVDSYVAQAVERNKIELNWSIQKPCQAEAEIKGPFKSMIGCRRFCRVGCKCEYNEFEEFYRCK